MSACGDETALGDGSTIGSPDIVFGPIDGPRVTLDPDLGGARIREAREGVVTAVLRRAGWRAHTEPLSRRFRAHRVCLLPLRSVPAALFSRALSFRSGGESR